MTTYASLAFANMDGIVSDLFPPSSLFLNKEVRFLCVSVFCNGLHLLLVEFYLSYFRDSFLCYRFIRFSLFLAFVDWWIFGNTLPLLPAVKSILIPSLHGWCVLLGFFHANRKNLFNLSNTVRGFVLRNSFSFRQPNLSELLFVHFFGDIYSSHLTWLFVIMSVSWSAAALFVFLLEFGMFRSPTKEVFVGGRRIFAALLPHVAWILTEPCTFLRLFESGHSFSNVLITKKRSTLLVMFLFLR